MAEYIKNWLKTILYMDIFLSITGVLLEKTRFESYMKYFTGFIMLSVLLQPVFRLAGIEQLLDASWLRSSLFYELRSLENNDMEEAGKELMGDYRKMIEKQIVSIGESCGISVKKAETVFDDSGKNVTELKISIWQTEETCEARDLDEFRNTLARLYQLEGDQVKLKQVF